ncbi:MAG: hypothetical protein WA902_15535 [Thermosynechococcaceae cyanobacterium]
MTPDEIQNAIEGLLSVQRNLQEGQLRLQEGQQETKEQIQSLVRVSENVLDIQQAQSESINQLKRAVDYLMSKDGGEG